MRFYTASSLRNIRAVRRVNEMLTGRGHLLTYDWTQGTREGTTLEQLADIGRREKAAVMEADLVLILLPAGKGSHIELGMALALGKRAILYDPNHEAHQWETTCTFYLLDEVEKISGTLEELVERITARCGHEAAGQERRSQRLETP